jgi:hypothetical protein
MARSPAVNGASPGGQFRHFWVPANAASTPASSMRSSRPASDVTQSISSSASCARHASARPSSDWPTPVDVSLWTTNIASKGSLAAAISCSGSIARPQSASTRTTSAPARRRASDIRSPNSPFTPTTTRSPARTKLHTIASIPALPVPDTGRVARLAVTNVSRSIWAVSFMSATKLGSRWPTVGRASACRTRSGTGLGPEPNSNG